MRRENPGIEQMVAWPAKDAAVTVAAADAGQGRVIPLELATSAVEQGAAKTLKKFQVLGRDPLLTPAGQAVVIHASAEDGNGQKMEMLFGVFVDASIAIQVTAVARASKFPELEEELRGIISSVRW